VDWQSLDTRTTYCDAIKLAYTHAASFAISITMNVATKTPSHRTPTLVVPALKVLLVRLIASCAFWSMPIVSFAQYSVMPNDEIVSGTWRSSREKTASLYSSVIGAFQDIERGDASVEQFFLRARWYMANGYFNEAKADLKLIQNQTSYEITTVKDWYITCAHLTRDWNAVRSILDRWSPEFTRSPRVALARLELELIQQDSKSALRVVDEAIHELREEERKQFIRIAAHNALLARSDEVVAYLFSRNREYAESLDGQYTHFLHSHILGRNRTGLVDRDRNIRYLRDLLCSPEAMQELGSVRTATGTVTIEADAEHGESQMELMLRDRPKMTFNQVRQSMLYLWCLEGFASTRASGKVWWRGRLDGAQPKSGARVFRDPATSQLCIYVRATPSEIDSFDEEAWALLVFELTNARHFSRSMNITAEARKGQLLKEDFVFQKISFELNTAREVRLVHSCIVEPVLASSKVKRVPTSWHHNRTLTRQWGEANARDFENPHRRMFESQYNRIVAESVQVRFATVQNELKRWWTTLGDTATVRGEAR
jgi:hypothetical protein